MVIQGSTNKALVDVTDPTQPKVLCTITGTWSPQLVTQRMISWSATQGGSSYLVTRDLFAGVSLTMATWQGGQFLDGIHTWSSDESSIAYVTSDSTAVNLHVLSGGGDRVITQFAAVPGRGVNGDEDSAYLGFSADGTYLAFVQTFAGNGAQLQVRRTKDGTLAYSQPTGTMAAWASSGSSLYFREPAQTTVHVWTPTGGVTQLFALQQAWIRPTADAGDDYIAYTVRDAKGLPHAWLYGHGGRAGGELGNVRSSVAFLGASAVFLVEEVSCGTNCGPGPPTQPDGKTFVYDLGSQKETPSSIQDVLGTWPRIGQT